MEIVAADGGVYSALVPRPVGPGETMEFRIPTIPPGPFYAYVTLSDESGMYSRMVQGYRSPDSTAIVYHLDVGKSSTIRSVLERVGDHVPE